MVNKEKTLTEQITSTKEGMIAWQKERAKFETTERICELMEQQNVSRAVLADRLRTSRSYVTQLLDGTANMTLDKVTEVYFALGRQFHPHDVPISIENDSGPTILKLVSYYQRVRQKAQTHTTLGSIKVAH